MADKTAQVLGVVSVTAGIANVGFALFEVHRKQWDAVIMSCAAAAMSMLVVFGLGYANKQLRESREMFNEATEYWLKIRRVLSDASKIDRSEFDGK